MSAVSEFRFQLSNSLKSSSHSRDWVNLFLSSNRYSYLPKIRPPGKSLSVSSVYSSLVYVRPASPRRWCFGPVKTLYPPPAPR